MKVVKFGSSAVATAEKIKASANIAAAHKGENNIIVVSSIKGTTNCLMEIADYLYKKNPDGAKEMTNALEQKAGERTFHRQAARRRHQEGTFRTF